MFHRGVFVFRIVHVAAGLSLWIVDGRQAYDFLPNVLLAAIAISWCLWLMLDAGALLTLLMTRGKSVHPGIAVAVLFEIAAISGFFSKLLPALLAIGVAAAAVVIVREIFFGSYAREIASEKNEEA